jgi:hypothetical protein
MAWHAARVQQQAAKKMDSLLALIDAHPEEEETSAEKVPPHPSFRFFFCSRDVIVFFFLTLFTNKSKVYYIF